MRNFRLASMRPRVFPAEDCGKVNLAAGWQYASMRPRVFPAEDLAIAQPLQATNAVIASMRPRVFPAEDCALVYQ